MDGELLWIVGVVPLLLAVVTAFVLLVVKTPARERAARRLRMREAARRLGLRYLGKAPEQLPELLPECSLLGKGNRRQIDNVMADTHRPPRLMLFDYDYTCSSRDGEGSFSEVNCLVAFVHLSQAGSMPRACLFRKDWFGGPTRERGLQPIVFENDVTFSEGFLVRCASTDKLRSLLGRRAREALKDWRQRGPNPVVELMPYWVLVYVESDPAAGSLVRRATGLARYAVRVAESLRERAA